ncbi:MAG: glycosyltransferase [Vicinamibacteria bacterium]
MKTILDLIIDLIHGYGRRGEVRDLVPGPVDRVPRLIHLIYGLWSRTGRLPWHCRSVLGAWRRHHPGWTVVLWGRQQGERLVKESFPELWPTYQQLARPAQRCDLLRYLILKRFGGVYADLDLHCRTSVEPWLPSGAALVTLVERHLTAARAAAIGLPEPIRQGRAETLVRIANFFLAASPSHPLLTEIVEMVQSRAHLEVRRDYDVLFTTGPDVISEVVARARPRPDLIVIDREQGLLHVTHLQRGTWRQDKHA